MNYRFHDITLTSEIPLPEIRRAKKAGGRRVSIELGEGPAADPDRWFHRWRIKGVRQGSRQNVWLSFARQTGGYLLRFTDLADFEISSDGARVVCRPIGRIAPATLRHLLLDQVLPLVLSQSGHLVLHASAVHVPGVGAIGFAGPSGSGKSTMAAALGLRGCQMITDDCLVVTAPDETPLAVPGYPGLRLWRDASRGLGLVEGARGSVAHYTAKRRLDATAIRFRSRPSPLRAMVVMGTRRPAGKPTRGRPLRARERLVALAPYVYILDVEEPRQLARMFGDLSALAGRIPILRVNVRQCTPRRLLQAADEVLALARSW